MGSGAAKARGKKAAARMRKEEANSSPWSSSARSTPKGKHGGYLSQSPKVNILQEQQSVRRWQQYAMNNGAESLSGPQPFTLSQEARNTERHGSGWLSKGRLRDQGIRFVSAGNLHQDPPDVEGDATDSRDGKDTSTAIDDTFGKSKTDQTASPLNKTVEDSVITDKVQALDIAAGEPPLAHEVKNSAPVTRSRSESSVSSDSAEDVVVFTGRSNPAKGITKPGSVSAINVHTSKPDAPSERPPLKTVDSQASGSSARSSHRPFETFAAHSAISGLFTQSAQALESSESANDGPKVSKRTHNEKRPKRMSYADLMGGKKASNEEDDVLQDYIAHMKDFSGSETEGVNKGTRPKTTEGALDQAPSMTIVQETFTAKVIEDVTANGDWDSADLDDLYDLSTSEEAPEEIQKILKSRHRPSGQQYLVVGRDQPTGEARWITQEVLNFRDAIDVLRAFEAREEKRMLADSDEDEDDYDEAEEEDDDDEEEEDEDVDEDLSEDSEEAAFNDYLDNLDSEQDEADLIERRKARMTDEQLARLLAKQEELGLDADDVLLFDDILDDDDVLDSIASARTSRRGKPNLKSSSRKGRRTEFPSAEAFADALDQDPYGAFDIMDFDRPSLRPKKKGRKSNLPFELEDEELEMQLEQSWENDRKKKATKKREREELRAQGLLGSRNGKPALHMKYRNGMSLANVRFELKVFLKSTDESISLTAMDPSQRRQVHLIAHALKLKSKSQGSGAARYPVLSKTRLTPVFELDYSEGELDEILNTSNNPRQMYRSAYKGGKGAFAKVKTTGPAGKARRAGGGGTTSGARYMDGDVVGATAPEIGIENRGRAMLEKMGWTKGMGLGSATNMGIVVPVQHVVKNTKAGLG